MNKPIEYTDLSSQVYSRVKSLIVSNELKPGEKIIQEKLAEQLGVSRMPLHKAFQRLENELMVVNVPRRGVFVRQIDIPDIIEAFECRKGLEGIAAAKVAKICQEQDLNKLEELVYPLLEIPDITEVEYMEVDQLFHETIMQISDNHLIQHLNKIGNVMIRSFPMGLILPIRESLEDHINILEAFKERDSEKAETLIKNHSNKAILILEQQINKTNEQSNE
ncbi:MAG: FCD domain-containing protein [Bacteroidetes bacterium]|nr:FCD domain-containing protein [Bacteroidota bacterium]